MVMILIKLLMVKLWGVVENLVMGQKKKEKVFPQENQKKRNWRKSLPDNNLA